MVLFFSFADVSAECQMLGFLQRVDGEKEATTNTEKAKPASKERVEKTGEGKEKKWKRKKELMVVVEKMGVTRTLTNIFVASSLEEGSLEDEMGGWSLN